MKWLLPILLVLVCAIAVSPVKAALEFDGMSYLNFTSSGGTTGSVLAGTPDTDNALIGIQQVNANTVALCTWDFQATTVSSNIQPNYNSYSSSMAEVQDAINYIHDDLGMNVMLKPMVDVNGGTWRGEINPPASKVSAWFTSYDTFIQSYATLAEQNVNNGVTMLSVGCELNDMEQYTSQWDTLISNVRGTYSGKLTYAANWSVNNLNQGGYQNIAWWNKLDYVGIDAYFPLTDQVDPPESQLQAAWQGIANNIASWRISAGLTNEPVVFTEAGYEAKPGTNESPAGTTSSVQDIPEQADCYQALLSVMSQEPWWDGVFWWDWAPGTVPSTDNSFTPENKPQTLSVLESYYNNVPEPTSLAFLAVGLTLTLRRRPMAR